MGAAGADAAAPARSAAPQDRGIDNPLGARALYLGDSEYRIHGSNEPETIGEAVSSGGIRMTKADVTGLYGRAVVDAKVIVE